MTAYPLKTTRRWLNTRDLEASPTDEILTLKLRRPQIAPKGDLESVNPVTKPEPGLITKHTPVGTIGSCFSARIQDWLEDYGYNFVKAERDPDLPDSWACQSARFGVVYNTGCCAQVFEAALGRFNPVDRWWTLRDGRLQDPYRAGVWWGSEQAAEEDLRRHAACVRRAVEQCDVFIVTPGLSEVWRNREDGATYASAPPREVFAPARQGFSLAGPDENLDNLERMRRAMLEINPRLRIVIAMSPVPLTATFRPLHWSEGNAVSKASLRVAIDRFCEAHDDVIYFPSYELVTTLTREPFETDNLHVRLEHVERIMTTFMTAYGDLGDAQTDVEQEPTREEDVRRQQYLVVEPVASMRHAYLRETWRRLGLQYGDSPVAIVGAGAHTRSLAEIVSGVEGPRVVCALDDAPASEHVGPWPVRRLSEADPRDFGALIVSSDSARVRLTARARGWAGEDAVIETLYDGLPAGPYPTSDPERWDAPLPTQAPTSDWASRLEPIPGWLKDAEAELLFESSRQLSAIGRVVEIGSFMGRSTVCLACGLESADRPAAERVLAIDPHIHPPTLHPHYEPAPGRTPEGDAADPRGVFERHVARADVRHRVEILQGFSRDFYGRDDIPASLVFVDGDHSFETASADIDAFTRWLVPGGRLLVHDYGAWEGVTRAVDAAISVGSLKLLKRVESIAVLEAVGEGRLSSG